MLTRRDWALRQRLLEEERKQLVPVAGGATILLVEDDHEMREMLARTLRRDGYIVIEAADGDDALEWLGIGALAGEPARRPALLVSDIRLPRISGFDLAEGLALAGERLPIVLITGFGDAETHARASELGASCVLDKPFDLTEFRYAVRAALRHRTRPAPSSRDGDAL